jgi:chromosome segregation ATPase
MERAKEILENSAKKDGKSEELLHIENKIKEEREKKDNLYREIGKIEGELSANQRQIEKMRAEMKSEESKTVPLKEVEELEQEISAFSEVAKIMQKIREFIGKHKANFENKNLERLEESILDLGRDKIKIEEKILGIDSKLRELDSSNLSKFCIKNFYF